MADGTHNLSLEINAFLKTVIIYKIKVLSKLFHKDMCTSTCQCFMMSVRFGAEMTLVPTMPTMELDLISFKDISQYYT